MNRFTVNIPSELKNRIDKIPEINWSQVAKNGIINKINRLEKFEDLENNGDL